MIAVQHSHFAFFRRQRHIRLDLVIHIAGLECGNQHLLVARGIFTGDALIIGLEEYGEVVLKRAGIYGLWAAEMDFAAELESQIRDGLPLAVLALYEKYTCLHFGRVLSRNMSAKNNRRQVRELKRRMLEFKAYGTVGEAMISRWHNVRMIYAHLLDCFGVERSIQELSDKLEILSDAQKETEEARTNALMTGITIFGIISILDSLLSIYEVIVNVNTAEWLMLRVSVAVIALLFMGFLLLVRGRRK